MFGDILVMLFWSGVGRVIVPGQIDIWVPSIWLYRSNVQASNLLFGCQAQALLTVDSYSGCRSSMLTNFWRETSLISFFSTPAVGDVVRSCCLA